MSYTSLEEIPFNIRRCYDDDDLLVWMTKYNEFYTQIKDGRIVIPERCPNDAMYARELAFEACKNLPSSRYIEASCTVEVLDRQNEVADIESYFEGSADFIDFGGIGIQQHSSKVISTVWKAYLGTDEVTGKPAIFTCENYFRGKKLYDDAWYAVLNGGLSEKSIGSRIDPAKSKVECDGNNCHTRVYADQWFELSSVYRGANPRTYIIDKHEALKSFGNLHIVEINDRYKMCPIKEAYLSFKSDIADADPIAKVHYLQDGMMYISGNNRELYKQIISHHYPDANTLYGSIKDIGDFTFIIDREKGDLGFGVFDSLMLQVDDERQAISSYGRLLDELDFLDLDPDTKNYLEAILQEIVSDEQRHIGTLITAIKKVSDRFGVNFEEGGNEAKEIAEKGDSVGGMCPEGQHEHAGISGCHDIAREHPELSDGNNQHSSHNLASMSDSDLRKLLVSTTALIREYPREKIETFLSSPTGKKYVMLYLELQRRRKASEYTESKKMSEQVEETALKEDATSIDIDETKGCEETSVKEDVPDVPAGEVITMDVDESKSESEEGSPEPSEGEVLKSDSDLPTAIANLSSLLVSINSKIEVMSARLDGLENMTKMQMDTKSTLADEVMDEVAREPVVEEAEKEISPDVPPVTEDADEEKDEVSDDEKASEDVEPEESASEEPEPEGDKPEEKEEDAPKDEDKPPEEDKSDDESKDDDTSDENKKKAPEIKEKSADSMWDDVSALSKRISQLRNHGVSIESASGGNSISAGYIKLKTDSGISLVDTPSPAPYTPASESYKSSGDGSMFDQVIQAMESLPSNQFNKTIKNGVFRL